MNIIHSVWNADPPRMQDQHKLAALSNFLAKKRGFNTNLYICSKDYPTYWKIKYDNIKVLPHEELNSLPRTFWSVAKLVSTSYQTTPFLHIDLDVLIYNRKYEFIRDLMEKKFLIYHNEYGNDETNIKNIIKYLFDNTDYSLNIDLDRIKSFNPKNFGIFGTYYIDQVGHIANAAKKLLEYLRKYKAFYESQDLKDFLAKENCPWWDAAISILLEQIIFYNMATSNLAAYECGSFCDLTENFPSNPDKFKKFIYHMQSNKPLYLNHIDEILASYGVEY